MVLLKISPCMPPTTIMGLGKVLTHHGLQYLLAKNATRSINVIMLSIDNIAITTKATSVAFGEAASWDEVTSLDEVASWVEVKVVGGIADGHTSMQTS